MQTSELSERVEAAILEQVFSDDELENRIRSLLRWKIRFNAVDVAVESGHVTLSGQVISALDRETAEQTIRRLRGVVGVTNCIIASPDQLALCQWWTKPSSIDFGCGETVRIFVLSRSALGPLAGFCDPPNHYKFCMRQMTDVII